jgi:4-cresol dehydrogenase (hydroxylating)
VDVPRVRLYHGPSRLPDQYRANKKTRELVKHLIQVAADHGWGEYCTPRAFQQQLTDVYSYNNHALRRLHETLKDAVDPNGTISAGRYGIWPKQMRG